MNALDYFVGALGIVALSLLAVPLPRWKPEPPPEVQKPPAEFAIPAPVVIRVQPMTEQQKIDEVTREARRIAQDLEQIKKSLKAREAKQGKEAVGQ